MCLCECGKCRVLSCLVDLSDFADFSENTERGERVSGDVTAGEVTRLGALVSE